MPIPDFQSVMRPLLNLVKDGADHTFRESIEALAKHFAVSEEERRVQLPSGRAELFVNRVGWAKTHLRMAGLIENRSRGIFRITERGLQVLRDNPTRIDMKVLQAEPSYSLARGARSRLDSTKPKGDSDSAIEDVENRTPEEVIEEAYVTLRENIAKDLLQRLKTASPHFFERLVVELLVKMGYGGTRKDAGQAIGKSGDEGIDGIIKEDRLGLDTIYIQAKRWENSVGRPEIQKFAGALQGFRAKKGIFITTAEFTSEARHYAERIDSKIVLLDGSEVAELMIDFGLGVSSVASYEVKRVDSDYFSEEG
jgi:restriction system protein